MTDKSLSAKEYFERGYQKDHKADWEGAIADYTLAIQTDPNFGRAYAFRALANRHNGNRDIESMLKDVDEAVRLAPDDADVRWIRASFRDVDGAIADYTEAIRIEPEKWGHYFNRGELYEGCAQFDADF
jgi:tetratricopeptide (TPR) repeat protein